PRPEPASRRGARGTRRQEPVPGAGRPPALVGDLADEGASGGVRLRPHAQDDGRLAVPHRVGDDLGDRDEEALHRILGERGAAGVVGDVGPQPVQVGLVELQRVGVGRRRGQRLPVALRAVGPRVHEAGVGTARPICTVSGWVLRAAATTPAGSDAEYGHMRAAPVSRNATLATASIRCHSTISGGGRFVHAGSPRTRSRRPPAAASSAALRQSASVRAGWVYQVRGSRNSTSASAVPSASRSSISCPVPQTATTRSPAAIPSRRKGRAPSRNLSAPSYGSRRCVKAFTVFRGELVIMASPTVPTDGRHKPRPTAAAVPRAFRK